MDDTLARESHTASSFVVSDAQADLEDMPNDYLYPPHLSGPHTVDKSVIAAFPVLHSKVVAAFTCEISLWVDVAKIFVQLPSDETDSYFLKVWISGKNAQGRE
ncbi:hypothetical protein G6011_02897 [Alternaria panax]|uniref:Uncharacterized protein n=1 Tax=Alternaria panax TaxID=48097 RepID=A0AAD4I791_9PLEO|nr:hypothetical protein G6011_02897 [Alternaria panax]